jgi:hypothetical protein
MRGGLRQRDETAPNRIEFPPQFTVSHVACCLFTIGALYSAPYRGSFLRDTGSRLAQFEHADEGDPPESTLHCSLAEVIADDIPAAAAVADSGDRSTSFPVIDHQ